MKKIVSLVAISAVLMSFSFAEQTGNNLATTIATSALSIDTLIADNTATTATVDKYGFRSMLAAGTKNATAFANVSPLAITFIKDYLESDGTRLEKMKGWAIPYFNQIDGMMTHYSLPNELKYLAVIESDLKHYATSRVGAKGPWQFMAQTARLYGLKVNRNTDERTDMMKSTKAAARYLRDLYAELHDWLLVIAAYNGGTARVYTAIRKSGSRNFWDLQYYLPAESRNHVKKFIATHFIMEGKGGITTVVNDGSFIPETSLEPSLSPADLANTSEQEVTGHYNAAVIAKATSINITEFTRLNPGFDQQIASSANSYNLRLPTDKMEIFNANKYSILNESVKQLMASDSAAIKYPSAISLPTADSIKTKEASVKPVHRHHTTKKHTVKHTRKK